MTDKDKNIINRLKRVLNEKYQGMILNIIVYGSRITKNKIDSDLDLVIITAKKTDWKKQREIKNTIYEIGIETDVVFDPKVFCINDFHHRYKSHPFFNSIENTGIYL